MTATPVGRMTHLWIYTNLVIAEGDVIQTPTGRSYRVLEARPGLKRRARWTCVVIVIDQSTIDPADFVLPITWHNRPR